MENQTSMPALRIMRQETALLLTEYKNRLALRKLEHYEIFNDYMN
jgi:hypothetical protein